MYKGKIKEVGLPQDIIHNPKHPYTKALVGAVPQFGSHYSLGRMQTILEEERKSYE